MGRNAGDIALWSGLQAEQKQSLFRKKIMIWKKSATRLKKGKNEVKSIVLLLSQKVLCSGVEFGKAN